MDVVYAVPNLPVRALLTAKDMSVTSKIASESRKEDQGKYVMPVFF